MDKIYLVCEVGFDYDDNNYYRNGDGGLPRTAYTSLEKAVEACDKLNVQAFKNLVETSEIGDYTDEYRLSPNEDFEKLCKKYFNLSVAEVLCERNLELVVEPSEEEWLQLFNYFNLDFYEVHTVDVTNE